MLNTHPNLKGRWLMLMKMIEKIDELAWLLFLNLNKLSCILFGSTCFYLELNFKIDVVLLALLQVLAFLADFWTIGWGPQQDSCTGFWVNATCQALRKPILAKSFYRTQRVGFKLDAKQRKGSRFFVKLAIWWPRILKWQLESIKCQATLMICCDNFDVTDVNWPKTGIYFASSLILDLLLMRTYVTRVYFILKSVSPYHVALEYP